MRFVFFFIWLFTSVLTAQDIPEMKVYLKNYNMDKGYRTLKTTFSDSLVFKKRFKDSNYTLDHVLRFYYATAIDLESNKNELISMNGQRFQIQSENPEDMVNEVILLVGNMYYGKKEDAEFKKKIQID